MKKTKFESNPMLNPVPIVLVGATVDGKPNYTTVEAFGIVCLEPIYYISLKSTHCSARGIRESGYFSVNLPSPDLLQKTDYCGMISGNDSTKNAIESYVLGFSKYFANQGEEDSVRSQLQHLAIS